MQRLPEVADTLESGLKAVGYHSVEIDAAGYQGASL
jgi:hypothetical protein